MNKCERRIKRLEQWSKRNEEELTPPEVNALIEELSGIKMTEEEKRTPRRHNGIPPEVQKLIDELLA